MRLADFTPAGIMNSLGALVYAGRIARYPGIRGGVMPIVRAGRRDPDVLRDTFRILSELPNELVSDFIRLYVGMEHGTRATKCYDVPTHLARAVWQARHLGVHQAMDSLRVLDIGTGFGYFPLVCTKYGHEATGIDRDPEKIFETLHRYVSIHGMIWEVSANSPLPQIEERFDLITAFKPTFFFDYGNDRLWDVESWQICLRALRAALTPAGRFFLDRNLMSTRQKEDWAVAGRYFRSVGGRPHERGWLFEGEWMP